MLQDMQATLAKVGVNMTQSAGYRWFGCIIYAFQPQPLIDSSARNHYT